MVFLLALVVRLVWNLWVHPLLDYSFSDMAGYLERANDMLDKPWKPSGAVVLFPYGTHVFLFAVKAIFGRNNGAAIGAAYALLGAFTAAFTYATAERFTKRPWVRAAVGSSAVVYYPWISLGGYALSETPFAFCVSGAAFFGLRLADQGRRGDAWLLGLFLGLGTTVRPQILVSAIFLAGFLIARRRVFPNVTRGLLPRVAVPILILVAASSYRLYWHTEKIGLVSTNGPLNFVFGRCHASRLNAKTKTGSGHFGPPALGALAYWEKEHPNPLFTLDPALGPVLLIRAKMGDAEANYALAAECVRKTGYWRQFKYAVTHVVLLWGYNIIWPDAAAKLPFMIPMIIFCGLHATFWMPPMAAAIFLAFKKQNARSMLLALHVWAVITMAIVYFGDTRYRAPYDGIIMVLAFDMWATVLGALHRRWAGRTWWRRGGAAA